MIQALNNENNENNVKDEEGNKNEFIHHHSF